MSDINDAEDILGTLSSTEQAWVKLQPFLAEQGYVLRARYQPGWKPSWKEPGYEGSTTREEDYLTRYPMLAMDAVRKDGVRVILKKTPLYCNEPGVGLFLTSSNMKKDPRNHIVPILDVILLPEDDEHALIVMPLLVEVDLMPFETVGELLGYLKQFFEAVDFMHEHGVAHRDIDVINTLMDPSKILPADFHPVDPSRNTDRSKMVWTRGRTGAGPIRYYVIDLGISSWFANDHNGDREVLGVCGHDLEAPEMSDDIPYDPFKVDVRALGSTVKKNFVDACFHLEFLEPLIAKMMSNDPAARPTAAEALAELLIIISKVNPLQLRRKLSLREPKDWFTETWQSLWFYLHLVRNIACFKGWSVQ